MKSLQILFLCTGNSCRSQMAEGWARALAEKLPPYLAVNAMSAGLEAHGLNTRAVQAMAARGVDITGQRSTSLAEEHISQADIVVTVCSHADAHCPTVPADKRKLHMPFDDPARAEGSESAIQATFDRVCEEIREGVAGLLKTLTLQQLEAMNGEVYGHGDVDVVANSRLFDGFIPIDAFEVRHRLYAGGWSDTFRRELAIRPAAVGVLLYDPQRDEVVLVRQFRSGALHDSRTPWLLEIVAGLVDPDEEPEEVARRETREEANCEISALVPVCDYLSSPGWCDEKIYLFCGRIDAGTITGIHGLDVENEDILTVTLSAEQAFQLLDSGKIYNAMAIIALQWFKLNRQSLKNRWAQAG